MIATLVVVPTAVAGQSANAVKVYKDPTCGCCEMWVKHLRDAGFAVTVSDAVDMNVVKDSYRVPKQARSCHTGVINGLALEGHVPVADVQRFLKARPAGIIGLAVPGMPIGSPGMEVPGNVGQPYDVLAFDKTGKTTVFARHAPRA
jgi:hypothetical protein